MGPVGVHSRITGRKLIELLSEKFLVIPEEGWNSRSFALYGAQMILTLARLGKISQRRAIPITARKAYRMFRSQLDEVIQRVTTNERGHSHRTRALNPIDIELPNHAALWQRAIDDVFRESGVEAVTELLPEIQSTMAQGYSRSALLMNQPELPGTAAQIARQARGLAEKVRAVSTTTKKNIAKAVREGIEEGMTVSETAAHLENTVPRIFGNRALTIARTELNNAWTQGVMRTLKESPTITHFSVIGCEAREPGSPQFDEESTCNFEDCPIERADEFLAIGFHPNHTGNIVPSRFR